MRRFTDENVYHCRTAVGRRLDGGRWRDGSDAAPTAPATPGGAGTPAAGNDAARGSPCRGGGDDSTSAGTAPAGAARSGAAAPAAAAPAPAAPAAPWWTNFSGDAFVDAYANVNWNFPRGQFGQVLRSFDHATEGFALSWVGVNANYAADPVGATISLRFGPTASLYHVPATGSGTADNNFGLQYVRQAYATVKGGPLTLDVGKFNQPFGSEVPDAQLNMEYTRSLLFTLNQPVFFTGLRLDIAPIPMIDIKLIAANGWNNSIDNNTGKTFAAQFSIKPIDQFQIYVGYAGGPEQADFTPVPAISATGITPPIGSAGMTVPGADSSWRHLVDVVADINPTSNFRILGNFDYDTEQFGGFNAVWWGINGAVHYGIGDFGITGRYEYWSDKHGSLVAPNTASNPGFTGTIVNSGTLTLTYLVASHFLLMLDNRIDVADSRIFATTHDVSKSQFTTTLGVIASTK